MISLICFHMLTLTPDGRTNHSIPPSQTKPPSPVHGAPPQVVLVLTARQAEVSPPVVAHTVHDDPGEDGAHGKGQDDGDGQQGDRYQLVVAFLVALTDDACRDERKDEGDEVFV